MKAYDIKGKRARAGVNQVEFAKRLGWYPDTVRNIENGDVDISNDQYRILCDMLDQIVVEKAGEEVSVA